MNMLAAILTWIVLFGSLALMGYVLGHIIKAIIHLFI